MRILGIEGQSHVGDFFFFFTTFGGSGKIKLLASISETLGYEFKEVLSLKCYEHIHILFSFKIVHTKGIFIELLFNIDSLLW